MSYVDSAPARLRQANISDSDHVTPPYRHPLRGKTLPPPLPLTTPRVHASNQHRAPTWSPGQVSDVENIPSDVRARLLPKGARRPIPPSAVESRTTISSQDLVPIQSAKGSFVPLLGNSASNVPTLGEDDTALSLDGSLQTPSLSLSPTSLHLTPSTSKTSSDSRIPSMPLNTSDDQTAGPNDTQSPHEDTNAEAGITLHTPTLLRPNLQPIDHSHLSSERTDSTNQATGGKSEITLDAPIVLVNQESGNSTHPHRWSKWGGSSRGLRHSWQRWRSSWKLWCLLAMVIALSLGIPIGFALRVKDISIPNTPDILNNSEVLLAVTLVKIDPDEKSATFDWTVEKANCNSNPCENYDIFFNQNLLASDSGTGSNNNIPSEPVFSINGTLFNDVFRDPDAEPKFSESPLQNLPFFTTKVSLVSGENSASKERTLQSYPFDRYGTLITIFAKIQKDSFDFNDLVPISISSSEGIAVGFTATLSDSVNDGIVLLAIDVARGMVVQVYSIVIVIAIWLVTLSLLAVTISVVFLRRKMAKEVMVVPVATLFAFTQLRGTLPGAPPGFGAIVDFVGVLPCLALLSLCSVLLLAVFLFYDPENPRVRKDESDPESKHL